MADNPLKSYLTSQEIMRQQKGWKQALISLIFEKDRHLKLARKFADHCWLFVGCGTSYHIAQTASCFFTRLTGIPSQAMPASEAFMLSDCIPTKYSKYLMVLISRSGMTTEVNIAAAKARDVLHIPTLAVTCDSRSELVRGCDMALHFPFKKEKSIVMTSSFTTLLLSLLFLAFLLIEDHKAQEYLFRLAEDSEKVVKIYEPLIKKIGLDLSIDNFVFLGQGAFYGIANEAALKLREMSLTDSNSYHTLEYGHGPISTLSGQTLVTFLVSGPCRNYEELILGKINALGGRNLVFHANRSSYIEKHSHHRVQVNNTNDIFNIFLYTPLLQLLGFYRAVSKKINPDSPRNLSHFVELELIDKS